MYLMVFNRLLLGVVKENVKFNLFDGFKAVFMGFFDELIDF